MVALAGMRRRLHLAQECVHFLAREPAAGADAAIAGHGGGDVIDLLLERQSLVELGEVVGKVLHQALDVDLAEQRRDFPHRNRVLAEAFEHQAEGFELFRARDKPLRAAACKLDPKDFSLRIKAAEYHGRASKFDAAMAFIDSADALIASDDERETALRTRIELLQSSRRFDDALAKLAKDVKSRADASAGDWQRLARYYEADRRWALADFESLEDPPEDASSAVPRKVVAGPVPPRGS